MSVAASPQSSPKQVTQPRAVLASTGNRVRLLDLEWKTQALKKPQRQRKPVTKVPESAVRNNFSVDSSASSDSSSSSSSSSAKKTVAKRTVAKRSGLKTMDVVPRGVGVADVSMKVSGPVKRCDWITPNSDPLYISFHDEEWGVPVRDDDTRLFELLVFSQALAELSWPTILSKRETLRELFHNFDLCSIAQFSEKQLLSMKVNGSLVLSESKLRAIVENAKLAFKVQQEFGSLSNYFWRFVKQKPIRNGFRYGREVPVKSPKAEQISKDMMQRGFRCVGPTVVYSFMQVAGIVNDHLLTCFRYHHHTTSITKNHGVI
ncbi:uncharacterized protein LOC110813605 [Carica papaya]|uniref:uncharacterized protein LOC110813605 n=1 Tax=Carica papaya TaxID=3649 RepID=UPI000B8CC2EA|nr:uncharacterized protein LOC110813605 [Carica papaya]